MKPIIRGLLLLLTVSAPLPAVAQTTASGALDQKIRSILPAPEEERWLTIPWRSDLMQARAEAQQQGKPLFLWIMDGHPLGCV